MTSVNTSPPPVLSGSVLSALGVVFGDIGTSPLYAFTAAVGVVMPAGGSVRETVALGLASLVFWSLFLVITLKYVLVILRTDQDGEGGVLALLTLLDLRQSKNTLSGKILLIIAIVGGAMLFGAWVVTPAISVLSAVEGLGEWSSVFAPYSVPIAVIILAVLFLSQSYGARRIGTLFGPVMLLWFIVLGAGGAMAIVQHPSVLRAVSPVWAYAFMHTHTGVATAVLGAFFLKVTGGEALYADLG